MDQKLRWSDRLHSRADFRRLYKEGRRLNASGLAVWIVRRPALEMAHPRLGLAIPRTYGGAVQRNRLKRILREIFRLNKAALSADADMVFSARPLSIDISLKNVAPLVISLWRRAGIMKGSE
jgi:ribonuclease P protein component